MKRFANIVIAAALLASCSQNATIDFTAPGCPDEQYIVKSQSGQIPVCLDTLKTDSKGHFAYKVSVKQGRPEFFYIYKEGSKVVSLLLSSGEKAVVSYLESGEYEVSGSKDSQDMKEVSDRSDKFHKEVAEALELPESSRLVEVSKLYVDYYRSGVRYIISHPYSLTVIPVLYDKLSEDLPVFSQNIDAIYFRRALDSLLTVYPNSEYVKALRQETLLREKYLEMSRRVESAPQVSFPELSLPDMEGNPTSLSQVDSKAVLLHFWSSEVAEQKMFNLDFLKPLYEKYHKRGLEIYAVDVNPDKVAWAKVVRSQRLPWINVNDGLGAASSSLALYNVRTLPVTFIISDGELFIGNIDSQEGLVSELERLLEK